MQSDGELILEKVSSKHSQKNNQQKKKVKQQPLEDRLMRSRNMNVKLSKQHKSRVFASDIHLPKASNHNISELREDDESIT